MITASEALSKLKEGNERYVSGAVDYNAEESVAKRTELSKGQEPWAIILGCADSRAPVGLLFDQGLGDLFVVRVAGNIATDTQVGSIEYAVQSWGTPLIVVLGHSHCGAVNATLDVMQADNADVSPALGSIVSAIRPALEPLVCGEHKHEELPYLAVDANVKANVHTLRESSELIRSRLESKELAVVGARYDLETGKVTFFD